MNTTTAIPLVRMDDPDLDRMVETLRAACTETGFFYLEGHGIPSEELNEVMQLSKEFFSLPLEQKEDLKDPMTSRGYLPFGVETIDPKNQTKGGTKEGFYIGRDVPKKSPKYDPFKLSVPNLWPTPEICPDFDCERWKSTMTKYHEKASQVGFRLTQLLALAIGLGNENYFDENLTEPIALMRMLHYSKEKSDPENGIFACGAHSDYGMLTLLLTDENPGLQVLTKDNVWMDVPPRKDAFIVNIGDMMQRLTNNVFQSTVHRVLTTGETERYSIPFFFHPNFDTKIECLDCCCSEDNPAQYPPSTSGHHLVNKYKQTQSHFRPQ